MHPLLRVGVVLNRGRGVALETRHWPALETSLRRLAHALVLPVTLLRRIALPRLLHLLLRLLGLEVTRRVIGP